MSDKSTSRYDISTGVLVDFTGLISLNLSNTGISELGGLAGLTNLQSLDISDNPIAEINVLVNDDTSTRFVNLTALKATNISTLTSIAGLVHVSANETQSAGVTWNFTGSTLTSADAQNHIDQINATKDSATFNGPTVGIE